MIGKLNGYLAVPHELMHIVAYRLIGKRCAYRLGDQTVTTKQAQGLTMTLSTLAIGCAAGFGGD